MHNRPGRPAGPSYLSGLGEPIWEPSTETKEHAQRGSRELLRGYVSYARKYHPHSDLARVMA